MNNQQRKVLFEIFARPTSPNVRWVDVVSLLNALGANVDEKRQGSRVHFDLNGIVGSLHRAHPGPTLRKSAVDDLREFLTKAGVEP
jgi:hypothetical protein